MKNIKFSPLLFLTLCIVNVTSIYSQQHRLISEHTRNIPELTIKNDSVNITISNMNIDVEIMGTVAFTTFDITFYNPTDRILEGELNFPLKDNQQIVDFAMDVNGRLRKGVIVEKNKGRRVFETIVREGIDPGLMEKTIGNSYRTRVYPILAKAYKRVKITCQENMELNKGNCEYILPMDFNTHFPKFSLSISVYKSRYRPVLISGNHSNLNFTKWNDTFIAKIEPQPYFPRGFVSIQLHKIIQNESVFMNRFLGENYFSTSLYLNPNDYKKKTIDHLHILWDVSGSAMKRDISKEIELLEKYLNYHKDLKVSLSTYNYQLKFIDNFNIVNGNCVKLREVLLSLKYDGGTNLNTIKFQDFNCDEIIMVSDGISNMGDLNYTRCNIPVIAINSALNVNNTLLKVITQQTFGTYINLTNLNIHEAFDKMTSQPLSFKLNILKGTVEELLPSFSSNNTQLNIEGKVKSSHAEMEIAIYSGKERLKQKVIKLDLNTQNTSLPIHRFWAAQKIESLMMQDNNKDEIIALAKQFGIVTEYTSLMVLDRIEDYIRFEITPPEDLKDAYNKGIEKKNQINNRSLDSEIERFQWLIIDAKKWFNTNYPNGPKPNFNNSKHDIYENEAPPPAIRDRSIPLEISNAIPPPPPARQVNEELLVIVEDEEIYETTTPSTTQVNNEDPIVFCIVDDDIELDMELPNTSNGSHGFSNINTGTYVAPWDSSAHYIKTLSQLQTNEVYDFYYSVKDSFIQQPSFYLDIANYLFNVGLYEEAISVITNIAELQFENVELLRVTGYKLSELKYYNLSISLFSKALELRPEDLQSYRDLALVYLKMDNYNKAFELLIQAIQLKDFKNNLGIKGIILNELNNLINNHPELENHPDFKTKWRYKCNVDLRIVISWSSDNTDIDLWVTEPSGEKCFYSNKLTWLGGHLSQDITNGFGPEEYLIKNAVKGEYIIQANYFGNNGAKIAGPVTVKAEVFQNYGRMNQTSKQIVLQLNENKQVIDLINVTIK